MFEFGKERQVLEDLRQMIERDVRAGFMPVDEIIGNAVECFSDEEGITESFLRRHAPRHLSEAMSRLRAEQASWPDVTDFNRLERAFSRLESNGIVCRHNFSCCGSCAAGEIWDEIEAEQARGRVIRGCAHYNVQTTESAVEGHGLWFSYGSVEEGAEAQEAVGREIVAAMDREGLQTDWSGSVKNTIHVTMDWKRRLPPA